jgi:hypothetical protein
LRAAHRREIGQGDQLGRDLVQQLVAPFDTVGTVRKGADVGGDRIARVPEVHEQTFQADLALAVTLGGGHIGQQLLIAVTERGCLGVRDVQRRRDVVPDRLRVTQRVQGSHAQGWGRRFWLGVAHRSHVLSETGSPAASTP